MCTPTEVIVHIDNGRDEGGGNSARGPGNEKRPAGRSTSRRRGEVEVKVTVDERVAAAINAVQNGWPLEALGHHWMKPNAATQRMLEQIYEHNLEAKRRAVEDAVLVTDNVLGSRAHATNQLTQRGAYGTAIWRFGEDTDPHGAARKMIHHDRDPPAKRPPLRQGEG